jgi:hypothetical protein
MDSIKNQFNPQVKVIQNKSLMIVEDELFRNSALLSELKLTRYKLHICFKILNTSRREQLPFKEKIKSHHYLQFAPDTTLQPTLKRKDRKKGQILEHYIGSPRGSMEKLERNASKEFLVQYEENKMQDIVPSKLEMEDTENDTKEQPKDEEINMDNLKEMDDQAKINTDSIEENTMKDIDENINKDETDTKDDTTSKQQNVAIDEYDE